jgi:hypothetical protein
VFVTQHQQVDLAGNTLHRGQAAAAHRLAGQPGQVVAQILQRQLRAGGQLRGRVDEVPLSVGTPVGGDRSEQQQQCQARYRPTHTYLPRAGRWTSTNERRPG